MVEYCEKEILLALQRRTPPSKLTLYDINDYAELGDALVCDLVKLRATWPAGHGMACQVVISHPVRPTRADSTEEATETRAG